MDSKRTFFVTSVAEGRRSVFQVDRNAELLLEILQEQRTEGRCLLHEFVIMRDHIHLLVTPSPKNSLERLMQFIKGGFSYRYGKLRNRRGVVWQKSFTVRRVMNASDYAAHAEYIRMNPVKAGMVAEAADYP